MALPSDGGRRGRRGVRLNRGVFLALVLAVLGVGVAKLSGPLGTIREQQEQMARLGQMKQALLVQRGALMEEKRRLATDEGQEWAARRRGYIRQGERRLVFSLEEGSRSEQAAAGMRPGEVAESH